MRLWIIVSVNWLASLLSLTVLWLDYRWHVMHPHFFPLVALLIVQAAGGVTLLGIAMLRLCRGPNRVVALAWLLFGTAPLWFSAAHFNYGAWCLYRQHAALTPPVKMASAMVASLADAAMRLRYPHRHQGKHIVMICDSDADSTALVEAMDHHLERMANTLHRSQTIQGHWIRGPVFGREGWHLLGCAVGSKRGIASTEKETLNGLDRHEAAHFLIDQYCGPDSQPPCVLVEGWAESQEGYQDGFVILRAWQRKQRGQTMSLRELTDSEWYGCGEWPVYEFGGALVEYMLNTFGGEKFLELYTTCRRQTFAADCQRVLGVTIDELDRDYWEYIEHTVGQLDEKRINPLLGFRLADGVDRPAWIRFARQYADATRKLKAPLRQTQIELLCHYQEMSDEKQATSEFIHVEFIHDDLRHRVLIRAKGGQRVAVAAPSESFQLTRRLDSDPWMPVPLYRSEPRSIGYWARRDGITQDEGEYYGGSYDVVQEQFVRRMELNNGRVTRFAPWRDRPEPVVRLEFEYAIGSKEADPKGNKGWIALLPNRNWAVKGYEIRQSTDDGLEVIRGSFEYGNDRDRASIPQKVHYSVESPQGRSHVETRVVRCEFKGASNDAFRLASFGVHTSATGSHSRIPWYVTLPAVAAPISLLGGLCVLVMASRLNRGATDEGSVHRPEAGAK